MKSIHCFLIALISLLISCTTLKKENDRLVVLQMNIWQEGTVVKGGFDAIVNEIARLDADIVFFSEVRNYDGKMFISRIIEALREKDIIYYGENSKMDVGILSKYPIIEQKEIYPLDRDRGSALKAKINYKAYTITAYSAHLDYTHYACYLPRGYDGVTWKELEHPVTDNQEIEEANRASLRDEAIQDIIRDAKNENTDFILLGGDFNEPSHLDWTEKTKDLWDHRGTVIRWDCSVLLEEAGFKDAYRVYYPDPVANPGFTFPSDNKDMPVNKLTWAPKADERDRIDYIYYIPNKNWEVSSAVIIGPEASIVRSKRVPENSQDHFIKPLNVWPTDHKAVLAVFDIIQK